MNKSQRIKLDPNNINDDKHFKVKLQQEVDTFEFLSMSLDTKEFYQNFNADYGVLFGRLIANDGVGIENAKISIFIPLNENDENNPNITSIYPYKTPRDKNKDGKRYNLLPRVSQYNEVESEYQPRQPFGSFPIKPELVTNISFLNIYKKYYKYTTTTNKAGDYMIFGAPTGNQIVHMSVDITDIGRFSMNPAAMVNLGYSENLFVEDNTRIKESNDLDDLPHIETQEISVNIAPFWGDKENFEIGLTRQDFRIRARLENQFTIFGTAFTDGINDMWGRGSSRSYQRNFYASEEFYDIAGMLNKRIGIIKENIFTYPSSVSDDRINDILESNNNAPNDRVIADDGYEFEDEYAREMIKLDSSEYTVHKRRGDFVFILNCNRKKIITNELGEVEEVDNLSQQGIFTEFDGFMTFELTNDELPMNNLGIELRKRPYFPIRARVKIPQSADIGRSFKIPEIWYPDVNKPLNLPIRKNTAQWRHQTYRFKANKIYSVSKFHPLSYMDVEDYSLNSDSNSDLLVVESENNFKRINNLSYITEPEENQARFMCGVIGGTRVDRTIDEENPSRNYRIDNEVAFSGYIPITIGGVRYAYYAFGANWLNFAIYLGQFNHLRTTTTSDWLNSQKVASIFTAHFKHPFSNSTPLPPPYNYFEQNVQELAAGIIDTSRFVRSDLHWTDFVEVPLSDIEIIKKYLNKLNETEFDDNEYNKYFVGNNYLKGFRARDSKCNHHCYIQQILGQDEENVLTDNYKYGKSDCPVNGGYVSGIEGHKNPFRYFYLGLNESNCIRYLEQLKLI